MVRKTFKSIVAYFKQLQSELKKLDLKLLPIKSRVRDEWVQNTNTRQKKMR